MASVVIYGDTSGQIDVKAQQLLEQRRLLYLRQRLQLTKYL
jgi:hypothetical protein